MPFSDAYILFSRERDKLEVLAEKDPDNKEAQDLLDAYNTIDNFINVAVPQLIVKGLDLIGEIRNALGCEDNK